RKAGSLRKPQLLGNWLYGVAFRIATKAKTQASQRRAQEKKALDMLSADDTCEADWQELRPVLDEEGNRLPEKYRAPIILCYFEGKGYEEAAELLDCPPGTVSGRLARARQLLRDRLTRRGLELSAVALSTFLSEQAVEAAVPAAAMES